MSNTVAYSIGKASRDYGKISKTKMGNPGPGAYVPQGECYVSSPKWRLGSARRQDMSNSSTKLFPSPTTYSIKQGKIGEAPAYHMGLKTINLLSTSWKTNPGPGAYNP